MDDYATLGLPTQATWEQVRGAYHSLALQAHPLHHPPGPLRVQARERFEALTRAFERIRSEGHYGPDMDGADVDQTFHEELYALAHDLGIADGRSAVDKVIEGLVHRGCPQGLAQDVAEDLADDYEDDDEPVERRPQPPVLGPGMDLNQLSWEQVRDYYSTILQDGDNRAQLPDQEYARLALRHRRWSWFWLGLALVWLSLVLVNLVQGQANDDTAPVTVVILALLWGLWRWTRRVYLGGAKQAFLRVHRRHYYLRWFERMHQRMHATAPGGQPAGLPLYNGLNVSAWAFGPLWLGYRRMHALAWGAAAVYGGLAVVLLLAQGGRWVTLLWPAYFVLSLGIGWSANRLYFQQLQKRITPVLVSCPELAAHGKLGEEEPVARAGWILPLAIGLGLAWGATAWGQ